MSSKHSQDSVAPLNPAPVLELGKQTRQRAGSISLAQSFPYRPAALGVQGPTLSRRNSVLSSEATSPHMRRKSLSFSRRASLASWLHMPRVSFSGMPLLQRIPEIRLENTYQMGPDEGCRFDTGRMHRILSATLEGYLADTHYSPSTSSQLCHRIADMVHARAKEACPPRYKMVCQVVLGQHSQQGLQVASQCLWDKENDNFTSAVFQNASIFAVAIVHAVYFE